MTNRTYKQKAATYYSVWKANPDITLKTLQDRYKNTPNSMRRTDMADILRGFNQTKGKYRDTIETTRHQTKLIEMPRIGESYLTLSSPNIKIPYDENDDINVAQSAGLQSFKEGLTIFNKHKKRYNAYQIQLLVHCRIDTDQGDIIEDWVSSNAFPLELEITFTDIWGSFLRNLFKITQSVQGEISYLSTKSKVTFWHR